MSSSFRNISRYDYLEEEYSVYENLADEGFIPEFTVEPTKLMVGYP